MFATVGEDGSVRIFDTRELSNSTIIYESKDKRPLQKVCWNQHREWNIAVVARDDQELMIFDYRKPTPNQYDFLPHNSKVNGMAWSPQYESVICSITDGGRALIWDIDSDVNQRDEGSAV